MKKETHLNLMLITNNPEIASYAESSGVDRIFVDMEFLGKEERQKNMGMPLNRHTLQDVKKIKQVLKKSDVMVRINPPNAKTADEVNGAIDAGADCIMLPYFNRYDEVEKFLKSVDGRCKTNLLMETGSALVRAKSILDLPITEVHLGLNDLRLTMHLDFLYEPLSGGLVDFVNNIAKAKDISFGFGGVGSLSKGADIPPELIIKEHVRMKSERVILSRAFTGEYQSLDELLSRTDLKKEVDLIREATKNAATRNQTEEKQDHEKLCGLIHKKVYG